MSRRVVVATLLGIPVEECENCGATFLHEAALRLAVYGTVYKEMRVSSEVLHSSIACSLSCLVRLGIDDYYTGRCSVAERWSLSREEWTHIGTRNDLAQLGSQWQWDDTGESIWIRENAERLRQAGEIS